MTAKINREFMRIGNSKEVTVSVTFIMDQAGDEILAMRNAGEALKFYANSRPRMFSSWVKRIEIKGA